MRFIDEHRDRYAVALLLRVLQITASTYYGWRAKAAAPCDRDLVDLGLLSNIHEIWTASGHTYGADRVHQQLRRDGIRSAANVSNGWWQRRAGGTRSCAVFRAAVPPGRTHTRSRHQI
jgi:hypothetical protein